MAGKDPAAGQQRDSGAAPVGTGQSPPARPAHLMMLGLLLAVTAVAAGLLAFLLARPARPAAQLARPSGIPASVSTSLANLMQLTPVPRAAAPGFTLTDQAGRTLPLSAFRGKVVVLEFMDPHCRDICPIVSQEFVDAYHELGPLAHKVVFAAVNVNQYYASVTSVAAYSRAHQLTTIPGWHFFTGPASRLQAVWRGYNIEVAARNPNADILHTSAVYFIDPQGRERYLASPMADHTKAGAAFLPVSQITAWGHGIALIARNLAG